jgi:2'-5' RNA ligase
VSPDDQIRSFIAVDLAPQVRAALLDVCRKLAAAGADVRWVRPGGLHVTLKFLGPVRRSLLQSVRDCLAAALVGQPQLHLEVRGLGAFPSLRRPRVLWAGILGDGLAELARRARAAVEELGFEAEKRVFRPHVTLGRVRSMRGWERLEAAMKSHLEAQFGESNVDAVIVYRSTLRPDGAEYDPLWTIPLGGHREGATHGY